MSKKIGNIQKIAEGNPRSESTAQVSLSLDAIKTKVDKCLTEMAQQHPGDLW